MFSLIFDVELINSKVHIIGVSKWAYVEWMQTLIASLVLVSAFDDYLLGSSRLLLLIGKSLAIATNNLNHSTWEENKIKPKLNLGNYWWVRREKEFQLN